MTVDIQTKVEVLQSFIAGYLKLEDDSRIQALLDYCTTGSITNGNVSHAIEEKERSPRKPYNKARYKYLKGIHKDVARLLKKPEFFGFNLGFQWPSEVTKKLQEIESIGLEHTDEHVKKTLADKIGAKKMFTVQANGRINLTANIPKSDDEVVTAK